MTTTVNRILPPRPYTSLEDYVAAGGGEGVRAAREVAPEVVVGELAASGLRGRGGAGFPTGRKWQTVLENGSDVLATTVVVNAAEGEPGTFKDRTIIRLDPYQVLEGALIAAAVTSAEEIVIGIKAGFRTERERLATAVNEIDMAGWTEGVRIRIHEGPDEYLFGEETALLESIDGRGPFPRIQPPFRRGVTEVVEQDADAASASGLSAFVEMAGPDDEVAPPALVDNVETFANVTWIVAKGAAWFRELGTTDSPGTLVCTITGAVGDPGVGEVPMGTTLRDAIDAVTGGANPDREIVGVLVGASGSPIPASALDTPLTYEAMAEIGSGLGSGSYLVVDDPAELVAAVAGTSRFLGVESCGQCAPCKHDGMAIADHLATIVRGEGTEEDVEELRRLVATVADSARCSVGPQHQAVVDGFLSRFPELLQPFLDRTVDPREPTLIAELVGFEEDGVVVDVRQRDKLPDWSYGEVWTGETPVDRLTDHRARTPL